MSNSFPWLPGGVERAMTPAESAFVAAVMADPPPWMDVWLHADADGSPWLIVSIDFVEENVVHDTLRLDFDGAGIVGGWSRSFLNGDDGVRADAAGVDSKSPDGIRALGDPVDLANIARSWFLEHCRAWPTSDRQKRWDR